ncbi:MAG: type VI secretion system protein TssA [Isosphaeraceae bacterium]
MPTPPTIDLDALLAPIPGENPAGKPLAYEPEYDTLREARRSDDPTIDQGAWKREIKVATWDEVIDVATSCLANKTKDIQIAAWLTEALAHVYQFAGLRDGLQLLLGIQEAFWEQYYPEIEDGDLESRFGPFTFLNEPSKGLPSLIRWIPLTRGLNDDHYSFFKYQESRETDNAIKRNPAKEKEILGQGRITVKKFDDEVAQTPKAFYANLVDDLKASFDAYQAFEHSTDERFGRDAPSLINIGKTLQEVLRLVEPILAAKRLADPDPLPEPEPLGEGAEGAEGAEAAEAGASTSTSQGLDGQSASVPRRRIVTGSGADQEALDYGRLLIEFRDKAQQLAEAGAALQANREKYAELLAELKGLDDEYEQISRLISRSGEGYQLLVRLQKLQ